MPKKLEYLWVSPCIPCFQTNLVVVVEWWFFSCTTQARPKRYTIEWMQANRERERQDPHGGIDHGPSWLLILKVILLIVAVA